MENFEFAQRNFACECLITQVLEAFYASRRFPRVFLAHLPTPLEKLDRLSRELGGPEIWIKRDDCTGLSTGGNKTRKLEF